MSTQIHFLALSSITQDNTIILSATNVVFAFLSVLKNENLTRNGDLAMAVMPITVNNVAQYVVVWSVGCHCPRSTQVSRQGGLAGRTAMDWLRLSPLLLWLAFQVHLCRAQWTHPGLNREFPEKRTYMMNATSRTMQDVDQCEYQWMGKFHLI